MNRVKARTESRGRVRMRIRQVVRGAKERPRLAVFKSGKHIYAQVIDDMSGKTLVPGLIDRLITPPLEVAVIGPPGPADGAVSRPRADADRHGGEECARQRGGRATPAARTATGCRPPGPAHRSGGAIPRRRMREEAHPRSRTPAATASR